MSSENYSGKMVSVEEQDDSERAVAEERGADSGGAVYGRANTSERDPERMRAYDAVEFPTVEDETEFDLSVNGLQGGDISRREAEQHCLDRGSAPAVNGSWADPTGEYNDKTLYQQERIEAREAELEQISRRAGANPDVYPEASEKQAREDQTMKLHQRRMKTSRKEVAAMAAEGIVARGFVDDPREHVSKEVLAEVNQQAERVAERFNQPRAVIGKRLGEAVTEGADIHEAVTDLVEDLCEDRAAMTPLSLVEPTDSWATIEGVVSKLFEPASRNQQQVGIIEDESGSAKLTVWANSRQDVVLSEGDVVRVQDSKPGLYSGQLTLAAVSDTDIFVLEKGDGPAPMGGNDIEASTVSGSIDEDDEPKPVLRPNHREQWFFPMAEDMPVPEGFEGSLPSFSGIEARENVRKGEDEETGAVAYLVASDEAIDRDGVSWGTKKRREAENNGREQRLNERKYNVPEWKRTKSRISSYEHRKLSPFGADERMVHLNLPRLSNSNDAA